MSRYRLTVGTRPSNFGDMIDHGQPGRQIITFARHRLSGWRPRRLLLPHQLYEKDIAGYLDHDHDQVGVAGTTGIVVVAERDDRCVAVADIGLRCGRSIHPDSEHRAYPDTERDRGRYGEMYVWSDDVS